MSTCEVTQDLSCDALDRLCELTNIGAGHAAGALAAVIGSPIRMRAPRVVDAERTTATPIDPGAGIFFEVQGGIGGDFAVFLSRAAIRDLVRSLLGDSIPLESEDAASALSEIGNVLASHALSAVADQIGATLLPSIPAVTFDDPDAAFEARVGVRAPRIENALEDESGEIRGVLVWVPDSV
jgi:chemotaxis protein CheC